MTQIKLTHERSLVIVFILPFISLEFVASPLLLLIYLIFTCRKTSCASKRVSQESMYVKFYYKYRYTLIYCFNFEQKLMKCYNPVLRCSNYLSRSILFSNVDVKIDVKG